MNIENNSLKLKARKLSSGRCQVKFSFTAKAEENWYGYMLTEPGDTLKEVVNKITEDLGKIISTDPFYGLQAHLYSLGGRDLSQQNRIYLFRNRK